MRTTTNRSGKVVRTATGYETFIPNPLPPVPEIKIDNEMQFLLSAADRKLGRLDGITRVLPNPDLFLAMYVKKEAILSMKKKDKVCINNILLKKKKKLKMN